MSAVISIALPVFAVIAAGIIAGRAGVLSLGDSGALNKFVFNIAMPAALFGLTAGSTPPGAADAAIAGSYAIAAAITIFGVYFLTPKLFPITKQEAGAGALASTLGNAVFLGLPIALAVEAWTRPFIVLMLIEGIFVIAIGAAIIAPRGNEKGGLPDIFMRPIRNPLVIGMVAGFAWSLIGLPFSGPPKTFFDLLGRAAGPTALFSLGLFLATHQFPKIQIVAGRVGAIALAKMAILPAIAIGLASIFGVTDKSYLGALALFLFVPSAVGAFVMASQFKVYETEVAAAVLATTVLSVLSISAVLIVFA